MYVAVTCSFSLLRHSPLYKDTVIYLLDYCWMVVGCLSVFITTPWGRWYYFVHFADEQTEVLSSFRIHLPHCGLAVLWAQVACLESPCSPPLLCWPPCLTGPFAEAGLWSLSVFLLSLSKIHCEAVGAGPEDKHLCRQAIYMDPSLPLALSLGQVYCAQSKGSARWPHSFTWRVPTPCKSCV